MGHDEPKYTETSASQWWREGWGVYTLSKDSKVKRLTFVLDILHGHALLLFSYNPCIESAQVALCPFGTQVYLKFYTQLGHLSVVTCSSLDECMLIWIYILLEGTAKSFAVIFIRRRKRKQVSSQFFEWKPGLKTTQLGRVHHSSHPTLAQPPNN